MSKKKPGRKPEGLGPTFSCRLRADQDRDVRDEAARENKPLVTVIRERLDELKALKERAA